MQNRNISDIIEKYLKSILADSQKIEIKRSEIAEQFDVVPSQINYVIKTRFTIQNGYLVESKRGGGGYIRIAKVNLIDDTDVLDQLIDLIGESITSGKALQIIQSLYEDKFLTQKEANLVLATMDRTTLDFADKRLENAVRARILVSVLNRLRCAD
ncbi:CtsR family transcriptional regulator [Ligilactobacillus acidipiscis]|jgi:Transcriptional repressor of class III stress genes|uniref:Transcriptional regulator CtsR n=1 Tax=Ligilactobacillus acidipiscis TaxID=89059 RepID=A0A0R2K2H9_9LACO|nr:CtsR family transcriptional regulator [Ligilactobacillus acidipiscis]KRN81244.1 transcriptional regulator CtsR [Ligilactobacillus acidipiscis]WEV56353.1 CtsR family transcriptional regulator [Ligilactobacillus acidipiscis]SFV41190.1 Transcriptional regulator CtsR [Ligilactobacillus acidipiscis]